jgi:lauroyl/myristoyl acyltransferase
LDQQATRRSSGLARLSDDFAGAVTRGLVAIFAALPHRVALGIGRRAADLAYALGMRRRILRRNLELIYGPERSPEERARIARSATRNLFLTLVEGLRVSRPEARDEILSQVSFEPRALHEELLRETRGIVFVVAHSGNFDLCGLRFAQGSDERLTVVMKPPKAPAVNAVLVEGRERFGFDVLSVSEPGLLRRLIRVTSRGGRVCLLPDPSIRGSTTAPVTSATSRRSATSSRVAIPGPTSFASPNASTTRWPRRSRSTRAPTSGITVAGGSPRLSEGSSGRRRP